MRPVDPDIITLTVDRVNKCEIVTTTRRRWAWNYYITQWRQEFTQFGDQSSWRQVAVEKVSAQQRELSGTRLKVWRSDELEIRCGRENQHPERLGPQVPGWAAQENGKETQLWPIEWGSISCSSDRSLTPSHTQPFQIKWEVYFSKNCVARLLLCRYDSACICIWVYNKSSSFMEPQYQIILYHI